ncbi:hypothetical protein C8F04DRAFT_1107153 [Mycena alexandri]|uniref:Uncharacterized protein n=1 Tax=Mycena alexandri TaxID=1745969 RepID=A0AAD6SRI2_9AGAR|nr:hypothetical protein C8F04DRAFT_1107153 [Mycena alexandri]
MPPRQNPNPEYQWGGWMPNSAPPAAQVANPFSSPYPVDQSLPGPALHLQQPPRAPRLPNVPLPNNSSTPWGAPAAQTRQDVFPIDLTNAVDFHALARGLENVSIPEGATIYVLPPSRDRCLLQVPTPGGRMTTFSFIQYLQSKMRAPLTLEDFNTLLSPAAQQAVQRHFLSRSRNGERLWEGFVNGARAPRGPKGVVLLQGHHYLWGFSQDQLGEWIMDVNVPDQVQSHPGQITIHY